MRRRSFILHPFFLAIYPTLSIFTVNIDRMRVVFTLRALVFSLLLCLVVIGLAWLITRNWRQSGLIASLFLILFFSYGHVYTLLEGKTLAGLAIGRHRTLLVVGISVFLIGSWWIWKRLRDIAKATSVANVIAVVALVLPTFNIISYYLQRASTAETASTAKDTALERLPENIHPDYLPDVYYIVLDAYARGDVLRDLYGYDNSQWLDELRDVGFYIADQSVSNYAQTPLSITSVLNMDYLQAVIDDLDSEQTDYVQVLSSLKHSRVRSLLESYGYKTAAFATGYPITELDDVDLYLQPGSTDAQPDALDSMSSIGKVNTFEVMLLESTAAILVTDYISRCVAELDAYVGSTPEERVQKGIHQAGWLSKGCVYFEGLYDAFRYPFREHRERVQYVFDTLPELAESHGPLFVFAHIISPHFPYVFGANGEVGPFLEETGLPFWYFKGTHASYIDGYVSQITYVNKRMQAIVHEILASSEREPIIIVQGDHGPDSTQLVYEPPALQYLSERFPILNAYYFPSSCRQDQLYASITPVNSFRVVLNACFGSDHELLEDRSYWSFYDKPYQFEDVTGRLKP